MSEDHCSECSYFALAYYHFTEIDDPKLEMKRHKRFFEGRDVGARIYISKEGINGQMSASIDDAKSYIEWLRSDPRFSDIEFKIHTCDENIFPKVTVKIREQLVALDTRVDFSKKGEHVSPEKWSQMLEERDSDTIVLDVRNNYEWKVGHFEGSELPDLETFREFPEYVRSLKEKKDPKKTKVMMYCTGGIRCELYSALMKEEGFEKVYQLQGGVIKYGLKEGKKHWKGKLFVFDDRLVVPISDEEPEVIGECHHCNTPIDVYYNCANMDCNELFLCCRDCAKDHKGCCSKKCQEAPRVRSFDSNTTPKPFRKLPFEKKLELNALCTSGSDQASSSHSSQGQQ